MLKGSYFVTLLYALALIVLGSHGLAQPPKSPNFVIMYIDDLGYADLGIYADKRLNTPAVDQLVKAGQSWTNFYASAPTCSQSRGALLTGSLPVRTGLYGDHLNVMWPGAVRGIEPSLTTMAEVFKRHGYLTALFGKWHLGDAPDLLPTRHGFDEWLGIPYSNDMDWSIGGITSTTVFNDLATSRDKWKKVGKIYQQQMKNPKVSDWNVPLIHSRARPDGSYSDDILERPFDQTIITQRLTQESVKFIQEAGQSGQAFFLFIPHVMAHVPTFRSKSFVGKSEMGRYGDVLEELDWSVGKILETLRKEGLEDNTYIVFTSDNGPWLPYAPEQAGSAGPLRGGKGSTFEGGMRVMTIFAGPGIQSGVVSGMGMDTDIFNTFLALADLPAAPTAIDSVDLSSTLKNGVPSPRKFVPFFNNSRLSALRLGSLKLHFNSVKGATHRVPSISPQSLYDLGSDVGEHYDLSQSKRADVQKLFDYATAFDASIHRVPGIFDQQKTIDEE